MATKSRRLGRFVASVGDEPVFVGVDVHKHTYSVVLFCAADGQVETWNCPADEAGLVEQLKGLDCRIEHVVYETGPTGFSLCRALPLGPGHDSTMASLIREYRFLWKEHGTLEREVMKATRRLYPQQYARLTEVGGVGEVVATTFLAEMFAPERFDRAEEVSSYLGLAPVVRRSGESPVRARLRSVGQARLRSILIEGAWSWRRHDKEAEALYNRHLAKSGVSQKAICAVARKLAIKLWRLAVEASPASMEGAARAPRSA